MLPKSAASGGDFAGCWLGLHLYIEHIVMAEGWAHSAIHQRLKWAEVVHHSFLFLSLRSEKQGPKLLKLETENITSSNQKQALVYG